MKKITTLILLSFMMIGGYAQNSAIYKAEAAMDKKDFATAISTLKEALDNPKTTKQAEIYRKLGECYAQLFNVELLQATQKLPFDTLAFYDNLNGAIENYTKSHEADIAPDAKGKVKPQFVSANKASISQFLTFPYFAAIFADGQGKKELSRDFFALCLDMPYNPVFTKEQGDSMIAANPQLYGPVAYYAAMQSYGLKDWDKVLVYTDKAIALGNEENMNDLYQMKIVALEQKEDNSKLGDVLADAVEKTGDAKYMRDLITYYMRNKDREGAMQKADELISKDPNNARAYYIKGSIEMNMTPYNYEKAREHFQKAIDLDPNYLEAYKNMGACYINDVADKMNRNEFNLPQGNTEAQVKQYRQILQKEVYPYYNKALPYFEKLRELAPDNTELWAEGLYIVYNNLLMTEKAEEVKALIPNSAQQ